MHHNYAPSMPHLKQGARTLLLLLAICTFSHCTSVSAMTTAAAQTSTANKDVHSVQLSPSVLMMGEFDWALSVGSDGKPWSRCLDMVWRARSLSTGDRLNFVATHHWLPGKQGKGVSEFCYMHTDGTEGDKGTCLPWTPAKLAEFKQSMTLCFAETMRQGFVPHVRSHLDDGLQRGVWRQGLLFSPIVKYGAYSFADIMTTPLAAALRDAVNITTAEGTIYTPPERNRPVVYLGLQGEMSGTVMRYPLDWAQLIPVVKNIVGNRHADVKVGIGLNFNRLKYVEMHSNATAINRADAYLVGSGQRDLSTEEQIALEEVADIKGAPHIDGSSVKQLLSTIDFLGVSAYAPYSGSDFKLNEFENSAFSCGEELHKLAKGFDLAELVRSRKLELHYSEFGIGCGENGNSRVSSSVESCAKHPWAGIPGSYNRNMDPWRRNDLAEFRQEFYMKALQWLSQPNMKTYLVSEVFVWSMSTWDVFGIYRESSSDEGSYRDPMLVAKFSQHNREVIAAKVCQYRGKAACDMSNASTPP